LSLGLENTLLPEGKGSKFAKESKEQGLLNLEEETYGEDAVYVAVTPDSPRCDSPEHQKERVEEGGHLLLG